MEQTNDALSAFKEAALRSAAVKLDFQPTHFDQVTEGDLAGAWMPSLWSRDETSAARELQQIEQAGGVVVLVNGKHDAGNI